MTTHRELILRAVMDALTSDDRPAGVPRADRSRIAGLSEASMPAMVVYPVKEDTERVGQQTRRSFIFRVECMVDGSVDADQPVDALLDDMLAWCTKALAGSKLGGLAQDTQELSTEWEIEARDYAYARGVMDFGVRYVTPANDQVAR